MSMAATDSRTRLQSAPKGIIGGKYKSGKIISDVFSQPEYLSKALFERPQSLIRFPQMTHMKIHLESQD